MNTPDLTIVQKTITTLEAADQALAVLSWIAHRRAKIQAELKLKIAGETAKSQDLLRLEIEGAAFTFDEVEKSLKEGILVFAAANRDTLFQLRKTAKLTNGEIRSRKQQAGVELVEGQTEESIPRKSPSGKTLTLSRNVRGICLFGQLPQQFLLRAP